MDDSAKARIDRLEAWIRENRKDLCSESGKVMPSRLSAIGKSQSYWSDIFRRAPERSFAAKAGREVETLLKIPHLFLEGVAWPFENVDFERWEALTERQKGVVEHAINAALDAIEADRRNGTNS